MKSDKRDQAGNDKEDAGCSLASTFGTTMRIANQPVFSKERPLGSVGRGETT